MESKKYLIGGKLGDFIHALIVCKYEYELSGKKADIYISNRGDAFRHGVEHTYNEILPILSKQNWFNSLNIFNNQICDFSLCDVRGSSLLYKKSWIEIYLETYHKLSEKDIPLEYSWINIPEKKNELSDSLIINRSNTGALTKETILEYEKIIETYSSIYFVCYDVSQYDSFLFKNNVKILQVKDLYEMFVIINSGKMYLGNLSAPSAIATSLNVKRAVELHRPDDMHYRGDSKYYKNFTAIG